MASKKKETTAVAPVEETEKGLQVYDFGDDVGGGLEEISNAERSLPFLKILQAQSPECIKGPKQIEGAAAGMFLNSGTDELYDSITLVPAIRQHCIVEWRPRKEGGGIVNSTPVVGGEYPKQYQDAVARCEAEGRKFGKFFTGDGETGNQLKETFYVFCIVLDEGVPVGMVVVPFASTGIQAYKKQFIRRVDSCMVPVGNGRKVKPPMWAHQMVLNTVSETNDEGTWFNYVITFAVENNVKKSILTPDTEAYQAAKELNEMVGSGAVKADEANATDDAGGDAADEEAF